MSAVTVIWQPRRLVSVKPNAISSISSSSSEGSGRESYKSLGKIKWQVLHAQTVQFIIYLYIVVYPSSNQHNHGSITQVQKQQRMASESLSKTEQKERRRAKRNQMRKMNLACRLDRSPCRSRHQRTSHPSSRPAPPPNNSSTDSRFFVNNNFSF